MLAYITSADYLAYVILAYYFIRSLPSINSIIPWKAYFMKNTPVIILILPGIPNSPANLLQSNITSFKCFSAIYLFMKAGSYSGVKLQLINTVPSGLTYLNISGYFSKYDS